MPARVATASETVACERATIAAGISSRELMERAGRAAADEIIRRYQRILPAGVVVFTGPGNNGGDGWVVARCLAESEFPVTVVEAAEAKTEEARAAEKSAGIPATALDQDETTGSNAKTSGDSLEAIPAIGADAAITGTFPVAEASESANAHPLTDAAIVIDALLGTGASGSPRGPIASAIEMINSAGDEGTVVVALDVPSGLDATTGQHDLCVRADLTLTFGLVKRGQLLARDVCGEITALDIGILNGDDFHSLPLLVDGEWAAARVPAIPTTAHKGMRGRLAIVAGGKGMAGAAILAGKGALRSGIGLVHVIVAPENVVAIHAGLPEAIVQQWPGSPSDLSTLAANADAIAIGPGLGKSSATRDLVERVLLAWKGPVIVDADALNVFENDTTSLATLLRGRPAVITPHPAELGRLLGRSTDDVVKNRFDIGRDFARDSGAAVLLKGSPTVVFSSDGQRFVSAAGTAALATGGSGDVLTGIVGTLLAQIIGGTLRSALTVSPTAAEIAATAAFFHGRAAELCGPVRGTTLEDILLAMPAAWNETRDPNAPDVLSCVGAIP
jgi:ADP-dependent NAD(P)H-hydrate dehydratase / NAD(P)H-hydrate epimerase